MPKRSDALILPGRFQIENCFRTGKSNGGSCFCRSMSKQSLSPWMHIGGSHGHDRSRYFALAGMASSLHRRFGPHGSLLFRLLRSVFILRSRQLYNVVSDASMESQLEFIVRVNPGSLRRSGLGTISGEFWCELDSTSFPETNWTDLPLPVLDWWLKSTLALDLDILGLSPASLTHAILPKNSERLRHDLQNVGL